MCLVPDCVASPDVTAYFESPDERGRDGVPEVLTTLEEVADAVAGLIEDDALAGRVLVWWTGRTPRPIPFGDPGYAAL